LGCGIDGELTGLIKGETDRERGILELRRGSSRAAGVSQRERGKREESKEREREITGATTPCGSVYNTLTVACSLRQRATGQCGWDGRGGCPSLQNMLAFTALNIHHSGMY